MKISAGHQPFGQRPAECERGPSSTTSLAAWTVPHAAPAPAVSVATAASAEHVSAPFAVSVAGAAAQLVAFERRRRSASRVVRALDPAAFVVSPDLVLGAR